MTFRFALPVLLAVITCVTAQSQTLTSVTVSSSVNPSTFGQAVTLTATVVPSTAGGTVTFYDGVAVIGVAPVVSGTATLTTSMLQSVRSSVYARYNGDAGDLPSESLPIVQFVNTKPQSWANTGILYAAGAQPAAVAVGDFNGDGKQDMAVANLGGNNVSILLGAGDGTFQSAMNFAVGAAPAALAVADFNGDGKQDIAVANSSSNNITVLIGVGDGTFQAGVAYSAGAGPAWIAVADFNNDGKADIAVANTLSNNVSILAGNGTGAFGAALNVSVGAGPVALALADFDADGNADIAVANSGSNNVTILNGNGGGAFPTSTLLPLNAPPAGIAAGDFDADGRIDILVSVGQPSTALVSLLNNGDGTFTLRISNDEFGPPEFAFVNVADLNGDGKIDVAVGGTFGTSLLYGAGDGTFQSIYGLSIHPAVSNFAFGDFNGDGRVDIAGADQTDGNVAVILGSLLSSSLGVVGVSGAVYGQPTTLSVNVGASLFPLPTGTVTFYDNGSILGVAPVINGAASLTVVVPQTGRHLFLAKYSGDASYLPSGISMSTPAGIVPKGSATLLRTGDIQLSGFPTAIVTADFNGDGISDLAASSETSGSDGIVSVLLGRGDGTFQTAVDYPIPQSPSALAFGDFNLDGREDIVVANGAGNTISVLLANGNGTFQPAITTGVGSDPVGLVVIDFNFDGKPDVVTANHVSGDLSIMVGKGDGTFQPPISYPTGVTPSGLAILHAADGFTADLVISNSAGSQISYAINPGIGGLYYPLFKTASGPQNAVAVYGYDPLDVAVSIPATNSVTLVSRDAPTTPSLTYGVGLAPAALAHGDLNGDTADDVVSANAGSNSVSLLLAAYSNIFASALSFAVGASPVSIATGDFNRDTAIDIATANHNSQSITILSGSGTAYQVVSVPNTTQYTLAGTYFSNPSKVKVTQNGVPVAGVTVTFSIPPAEPSGFFAGSGTVATAVTNSNGIATAPALLADTAPGAWMVIAAAGLSTGTISLTTNPASCLLAASPSSLVLDASAGSATFALTGNTSSCAWGAASSAPWITVTPVSGSGSATITASVTVNATGSARTGSILIGGQTVTITQNATVAAFDDVPVTAYYFDAVNELKAKNITAGCGNNDFCPTGTVTRAEMAIFVVRAILGGDNFPYSTTPYFADVAPTDFGFQWIQKLDELGITAGCGGGNFCPNDVVTRDQMAIFIIRARYGATFAFDSPAIPYFTDVPADYFAFPWIQRLREDMITSGCGATVFCPTSPVIRGDMALFIMRGAFNQFLPPGTPVLSGAVPATIQPGASAIITVAGVNTTFVQGVTQVVLPAGFVSGIVLVNSPTSLTVTITAPADAALEPVSIQTVTGTQEAVLPNGLTVQAPPM